MVRAAGESQDSQTRTAGQLPGRSACPPAPATILRHCRCVDCRLWTLGKCPLGTDDPNRWFYCANYNGLQISHDVLVWPHMPRGAGNTSPSVVRGHAAAVGQVVHEEGRMLDGQDEGGHPDAEGEHPTGGHCNAATQTINTPDAATPSSPTTPPVGTRANMSASVEHVAKPPARTQRGPTGANVAGLPLWQTNGSLLAGESPVGTASSQPLPFCLFDQRT